MSKRLILIASIIGTLAGQVVAQPPAYHESVPTPTLANVRYGAHERQVLDFWKAPSASVDSPAPLVFYIHGGQIVFRRDRRVDTCGMLVHEPSQCRGQTGGDFSLGNHPAQCGHGM